MASTNGAGFRTRILPVQGVDFGRFDDPSNVEKWQPSTSTDLTPLRDAAEHLRFSDIPVGFPTETVYGLGADATRSNAVKGIYKAKGRPSDNPLIVHVCDLVMLRSLLAPLKTAKSHSEHEDLIPDIYKPLIQRFWPGPLTILLPNPYPSRLAAEVTAGLPSFGARIPQSPLALSLIHLAGVPLAAPSANASTKPSPTTAEHVLHDLGGRIEIILDGGPCQVGVESTVVDGLCDPPAILRPGGVSIDSIRTCEGWENVIRGYQDQSEVGTHVPRAPGMKYKHYSPKAQVFLYEAPSTQIGPGRQRDFVAIPADDRRAVLKRSENFLISIGIVSTRHWVDYAGFGSSAVEEDGLNRCQLLKEKTLSSNLVIANGHINDHNHVANLKREKLFTLRSCEVWQQPSDRLTSIASTLFSSGSASNSAVLQKGAKEGQSNPSKQIANIIEIALGTQTRDIAHGLFSALRELDKLGVDVIFVEGIEDEGDIAAAVMNRLRKAASVILKQ